jgi:hypothetical protein
VICFAIGDGESNGDKESNRNIEALMAKFKSMEKELKILRKQKVKSKAGPVKDNIISPPSSSGKKFKSTARSHFDPPHSGKQPMPASDSDKEALLLTPQGHHANGLSLHGRVSGCDTTMSIQRSIFGNGWL